jgi:hypothetical protein
MEDYPMTDTELIDAMVGRLAEELKRLWGQVKRGSVPAVALEGILRNKLWHVGAQALAVLLEALDRQLACGRRVHDHRTRTVVSLFGALDVSRSRCRDGQGECCPLDEALGLVGQRGWTVGVQEAVSLLSCDGGFETVRDWMRRLFGLDISAPTVRQLAESAGQRAEQWLEQVPQPPQPPWEIPDTLIIATDGCQAPQRDGWHEVKVATLYPKACRHRRTSGRGKLSRKEYFASLEAAEGFGEALWRRAEGWGVQQVRRVVVMGDGAGWIWKLSELHFPGAVEIVDFYHAVEHLWEVGEALWGDRHRSLATRSWVRHYRKRLKQGRVDLVLGAVERRAAQRRGRLPPESAKTVRRNLEYFRRNAGRMRYGRFRQMGLPIGTGVVEGSCKYVVQSRFKRPGSRWSHYGLKTMLALKLMRLNQRWELLWPHLAAA